MSGFIKTIFPCACCPVCYYIWRIKISISFCLLVTSTSFLFHIFFRYWLCVNCCFWWSDPFSCGFSQNPGMWFFLIISLYKSLSFLINYIWFVLTSHAIIYHLHAVLLLHVLCTIIAFKEEKFNKMLAS